MICAACATVPPVQQAFALGHGGVIVGRSLPCTGEAAAANGETRAAGQVAPLDVPCAQTYSGHARATVAGPHVCVVLNPRREIKVFAEGAVGPAHPARLGPALYLDHVLVLQIREFAHATTTRTAVTRTFSVASGSSTFQPKLISWS